MKRRRMLVVVIILLGLLVVLPSIGDARGGGHGGGGHGGGLHGGGFHGGGFHGRHSHHGGGSRVFIGGFFGFPFYPYGYYPYYPYADAQPPVYVEPQEDSEWYYCQDPQGYYPYVTSCPGGWTRVVSTPLHLGEDGTVQ